MKRVKLTRPDKEMMRGMKIAVVEEIGAPLDDEAFRLLSPEIENRYLRESLTLLGNQFVQQCRRGDQWKKTAVISWAVLILVMVGTLCRL